ncbi:hypothetical protein RFF05_15700 [Bengtsoniella intestinalis]|uniref:hypothetical protein n=1 Tax=Bengtsoniella intestinalis TaxID=3073143 RepID=UPI00391FA830
MYKWMMGALALVFCGALATTCLSEEPDTSNAYPQPTQVAVEEETVEATQEEEPLSMFQQLEQDMLSQIDFTDNVSSRVNMVMDYGLDDYRTEILDNYSDYFTLDSIDYGSYTGTEQQEVLVVFSVVDNDHVGGFGRKLMAIYDVTTGDLVMQHSFAGDSVNIVVDSSNVVDSCCVFMTATWTYQGIVSGSTDCGSLEGGVWTPIQVPITESDRNTYSYSKSNDTLTITQWLDGTEEPYFYPTQGDSTEYTFDWDTSEFVEVE